MRMAFLALAVFLAPIAAAAQAVTISATQSGVSGESLSATPMTDTINMETVKPTNQLSLTLTITPGTTTVVRVRCYQSLSGASGSWGPLPVCDAAVPISSCVPDVRSFTLSDYTTVGGVKVITTNWWVKQKYAQCSVDDPNDGTGTVVVTGSRSWQ